MTESHASYQTDKLEVRDLSTTKSRCVITKEKSVIDLLVTNIPETASLDEPENIPLKDLKF